MQDEERPVKNLFWKTLAADSMTALFNSPFCEFLCVCWGGMKISPSSKGGNDRKSLRATEVKQLQLFSDWFPEKNNSISFQHAPTHHVYDHAIKLLGILTIIC